MTSLGAPRSIAGALLCLPSLLWGEPRTIYIDSQLTAALSADYDAVTRQAGGGTSIAYRSLAGALPVATAGTTVILRAGTYADALAPILSGIENSPITFMAFPGETVSLTAAPAIQLTGVSHVVIDGFRAADTTWLESRDSHHNLLENCTFLRTPAIGTTGNARFVRSRYNRIRNNRFEEGNDNLLLIDSDFNVVEGNTLLRGRHSVLGIRCGSHNIIRGNYLANPIQKIAEVYDCGMDTSAVPNSFDSTKQNVFEDNVFAEATPYYSTSGGNGIQYSGQQGIIRRNVFHHCNVGIGMQVYGDEALFNRDNRIYHNVFANNRGAGIESGSRVVGNSFKNNIFSGNHGVLPDCFSESPGQLAFRGSLGLASQFEGNDLFYKKAGDRVIEEDFNIGRTVDQTAVVFPGVLLDTLEWEPRFVDPAGYDFHLRRDSPLRDTGAWLTKTVTPGLGKTLLVADAGVFHDGFGIPGESGDFIQLEGQSQPARILHIDYPLGAVVVDRELSWSAGQGISQPFTGSKPDLGAFETAATPTGVEAWRLLSFGSAAARFGWASDLDDPDGDGIRNLLEYALDGDPLTADLAVLPTTGVPELPFSMEFRRDQAMTDLIFTVQVSDGPTDVDEWTDVAESTGGAAMERRGTEFTVVESGPGSVKLVTVVRDTQAPARGCRFLRLKVTRSE